LRRKWLRTLPIATIAVAACGRSDSPLPSVSTCASDWVVPITAPVYADPLPVDAPKLLWSLTFDGALGNYGGGPVLAGDRLVVAAGWHLFYVTKDGTQAEDVAGKLGGCQYPVRGPLSPPTADSQGNVYVLGADGLCSLTSTGDLRWSVYGICTAIPGGHGDPAPAYQCPAAVVSSDGRLFAGAAGDEVFAIDAGNGKRLWSAPAASVSVAYMSRFFGGGGARVLLDIAGKGDVLLDAASGKTVGPMNFPCGAYSVGALGWMVRFECGKGDTSFDTCHLPLTANVTGEHRGAATVIAQGERLVMYGSGLDADGRETGLQSITLYDPDGSVAAGPAIADGAPFAVGADGSIYGWACDGAGSHVVAYARDLERLWHLDLPGQCYRSTMGAVLDSDGVLYVAVAGERYETTSLYAIQTRSPGLATSSWPHYRHDNHGTAWLDQPVGGNPVVDASTADGGRPSLDGAP
jgi:outer membrane protein assembly factor BamB